MPSLYDGSGLLAPTGGVITMKIMELRRVAAVLFATAMLLIGVPAAFSYRQLAPLAGSDSPESVLLLVPVAAFVMLAAKLAASSRHGAEAAVNVVFAFPFLLVLAALLVWLPVKLSYFYWVYRLDLLA